MMDSHGPEGPERSPLEDTRRDEVRFNEQKSRDLRRLMLEEVRASAPVGVRWKALLNRRTKGGAIAAAIAGLTLAGGAVAIAATSPSFPLFDFAIPDITETPSPSPEKPAASAPQALPFLPQPGPALPAPVVPPADQPAVPQATEIPPTEIPSTDIPSTEPPVTEVPTEVPVDPSVPVPGNYPVNASGQTYGQAQDGVALPALVEAVGSAADGSTVVGFVYAGDYAARGQGATVVLFAMDGVTQVGSAIL